MFKTCKSDPSVCDLVISHSQNIKCHTIFSKLKENYENTIYIDNYFKISGNFTIYLHDSNQLPIYPMSKYFSFDNQNVDLLHNRFVFKRLSSPYETDCQYYNQSIRSQGQCINQLVMKHMLQNNCLPKSDGILTYVIQNYNYSQFEYKICENKTNKILSNWMKICRKPCFEVIYEPIISNNNQISSYSKLVPSSFYTIYIFYPKLILSQYLVQFGGLLGLWYGISFQDFKIIFGFIQKSFLILKLIHILDTYIVSKIIYLHVFF